VAVLLDRDRDDGMELRQVGIGSDLIPFLPPDKGGDTSRRRISMGARQKTDGGGGNGRIVKDCAGFLRHPGFVAVVMHVAGSGMGRAGFMLDLHV
jgi:hypothetical protein